MDLELRGRRALVTGGSKGIGLAVAEVLAEHGAEVVLCARDAPRLEEARRLIADRGSTIETCAADLSDADERKRVSAANPDIDILVNNAGAIPGGDLLSLDMETWQQAWALKVMGTIHLTQLYLEPMQARRSGVILNIIGMAGRAPRYDYICGSTGNAALIAFTNAIGGRTPEWGVRVIGINPSQTRTERIVTISKARAKSQFGDESRWQELLEGLPFGRLAEPREVAELAAMMVSPRSSYLSGSVIDLDGGQQFLGK